MDSGLDFLNTMSMNPLTGTTQQAYEKAMADRYASTRVGNDTLGNPVYGYTGTVTNPSGINQSRAGIRATQPTNTGGGISISFGGGGGGGGSAPIPNNLLTPRTFPSYTSTYTPPTPATPDPYNWATRDPYIYGEGLSNAGAAYDIWGSAPGTNPYLLSTTSNYTPGLLGMQPVQLPANVPSTNVGANINNNINNNNNNNNNNNPIKVDNRTQKQKEWDRIAAYASYSDFPKQELKMASDQYAAKYGNEIFNNEKAKLAQMFPETNWDDFATPELRAKNQITEARTLTPPPAPPPPVITQRVSDKMDRDYSPPSDPKKYETATYEAKKAETKKAVASYNASPAGKKYSIDLAPKAGTLGGRPRL